MKKVLITGARGFFASRFTKHFMDTYNIVPLTRQDLDITNEAKVLETIKDTKPDFVIHTAAIADTGKCEQDKEASYNINVLGSVNVAKGCSLSGAKMIHLSSEQIYNGNIESGPYSEEDKPVANTTYGKHKLQAEEEIKKVLDEVWILRLTWLFGFPERFGKVNPNIIWNIVSAALKGTKINVPVNEYRGMTYVYDLLGNFPKILDIPYGIYNTGSENNLSTYDIAEIVVKEMGLTYRINDIIERDEEKFKNSPRDLRISNKKFRDLGIEFLTTEQGVRQCIEEFKF